MGTKLNYAAQMSVDTEHHVITHIQADLADKKDSQILQVSVLNSGQGFLLGFSLHTCLPTAQTGELCYLEQQGIEATYHHMALIKEV